MKPELDVLTLKLFDSYTQCVLEKYVLATMRVNKRTGRASWRIKPKRGKKVVFEAKKDTLITHGTLTSQLMDQSLNGIRLVARVPAVHDIVVKTGETLTLILGGKSGDDALMSVV